MIEHPNSLLLHHCLQAASVGDRQTLRALWADDIVWHVKGTGNMQGELKGADNIFEYLAELGELGDAGFHTEVDDVMVSHCLLYTSPSPRDLSTSRMPSSA